MAAARHLMLLCRVFVWDSRLENDKQSVWLTTSRVKKTLPLTVELSRHRLAAGEGVTALCPWGQRTIGV